MQDLNHFIRIHLTMNKKQMSVFRSQLLRGNSKLLENFYLEYRSDIKTVLLSKGICSADQAMDFLSQALVIFYDNVMDRKILELSSVKNYLIGICINLNRLKRTHQCKIDKKMDELKLLFYENNDTSIDDENYKNCLIKLSQKALKKLNEKCQKIIVGYYIHNWSMKEVAFHLSLASKDVAKTLKSRCFKTLMKNVSELQNECQL